MSVSLELPVLGPDAELKISVSVFERRGQFGYCFSSQITKISYTMNVQVEFPSVMKALAVGLWCSQLSYSKRIYKVWDKATLLLS